MTPLPKKKSTRARSKQRRNANRLKLLNLSACPSCGKPKMPHRACGSCGFYKSK